MQLLLMVYVFVLYAVGTRVITVDSLCLLYAVWTHAINVDGLCLLYAIWTHAITFAKHLQFVVVYFWWKQSEHIELLFRIAYVYWM